MKTNTSLRPKKVRILGREYKVKYSDDVGALGTCAPTQCRIEIAEDQHPVEEADTFVHEIFHALFFLMDIGLTEKQEENVVRKLATGFTQVLLDNPHLLTYLANAGPAPKDHS